MTTIYQQGQPIKALPQWECKECGAEFEAPMIRKCPKCGSRQLQPMQHASRDRAINIAARALVALANACTSLKLLGSEHAAKHAETELNLLRGELAAVERAP